MERLTQKDLEALLEFLRKNYARLSLDDFQKHILLDLPKLISSDITTYNEVNVRKQRMVWSREPAEVRFSGDEEVFARHIHEHPLINHYAKTKDGRARKISDFLAKTQYHRLGLYNEFFRPLGVEHQIAVTLPSVPPLLIGIALNRGQHDFTERDRLLLNLARPHLIQAYETAEKVTRLERELAFLNKAIDKLGHGLVVLTPDRGIKLSNPRAEQLLIDYFGGRSLQGGRLPEKLELWVKHQENYLRRNADLPSPREALVVERLEKRLIIALISEPDASLLLLEEQVTEIKPEWLQSLGLSRREAEVLVWVAYGKTNAEIGTILEISPETVKKHLDHIYEKLGVETRTAAASRVHEVV